jgi:type IV secretory pathway component VirB8
LVIISVSQRCKGQERTISISSERGTQSFRQGDYLNEVSAKILLVVVIIAAAVLVVALVVVVFVVVPVVRSPRSTQGCRADDDDDYDETQ